MMEPLSLVSSGAQSYDAFASWCSSEAAAGDRNAESSFFIAPGTMKRVKINALPSTAIPASTGTARMPSTTTYPTAPGVDDLSRFARTGVNTLSALVALHTVDPQWRNPYSVGHAAVHVPTSGATLPEEYFVGEMLQRLRDEASYSNGHALVHWTGPVVVDDEDTPLHLEDSYQHRDRLARVVPAEGVNFASALRMMVPIPRPASPDVLVGEGDGWLMVD